MAHIDDGKGSRSTNVEINIVPVIDLMSVLIVFLLITAVWNQISMIQLATSVYGKKSADQEITEQEIKQDSIPLRLDILTNGYVLFIQDQRTPISMIGDEYDTKTLGEELRKVKQAFPDKKDIVIAVDDGIDYGSLVKGMDIAISERFPQVSIATGGVE
ncbi:MAG: biopolymer transporter ExbD [Bdellovibrionaceae bacterium]|nr:biopolymer transporter ExbD [Pseudobdellovibrionaceae bacterium]